MINQPIQQTQSINPLGKLFFYTAALFCVGFVMLSLEALHQSFLANEQLITRVLTLCVVALALAVTAYVCVNILLSLEYRATENKIFKESHQQLLPSQPEMLQNGSKLDFETRKKILGLYYEMTSSNSLSLNQIALEVFGKKGGYYNTQIREALADYDIEI